MAYYNDAFTAEQNAAVSRLITEAYERGRDEASKKAHAKALVDTQEAFENGVQDALSQLSRHIPMEQLDPAINSIITEYVRTGVMQAACAWAKGNPVLDLKRSRLALDVK